MTFVRVQSEQSAVPLYAHTLVCVLADETQNHDRIWASARARTCAGDDERSKTHRTNRVIGSTPRYTVQKSILPPSCIMWAHDEKHTRVHSTSQGHARAHTFHARAQLTLYAPFSYYTTKIPLQSSFRCLSVKVKRHNL